MDASISYHVSQVKFHSILKTTLRFLSVSLPIFTSSHTLFLCGGRKMDTNRITTLSATCSDTIRFPSLPSLSSPSLHPLHFDSPNRKPPLTIIPNNPYPLQRSLFNHPLHDSCTSMPPSFSSPISSSKSCPISIMCRFSLSLPLNDLNGGKCVIRSNPKSRK